jgi:hypothetical protein
MTINSALKSWVMEITGYDNQHVILENEDGGRPVGPFATFDILTILPGAHPNVKKTDLGDKTFQVEYATRNVLMVSVEVYAQDGMDHLQSLAKSNYLFAVRQILNAEKLAIMRAGDPRKIPFDSDTNWKGRYQCDFTMNSYHTISEIIEQIEAYDFTGSFVHDEDVVETIGFSIP